MNLLSISLSLFLLMDPIGNIPFYLSLLKGIDPNRQRAIIVRELLIALGIMISFYFIGDELMQFLKIEQDTLQIAGGIILFLLCLKMIFPSSHDPNKQGSNSAEPFIVPLAVPLVAGPGVLTVVMIYARQEINPWAVLGAILIAWCASLLILLTSPQLKRFLGWRGITAMERLMGLILTLIAIEMLLNGVSLFTTRLHHVL